MTSENGSSSFISFIFLSYFAAECFTYLNFYRDFLFDNLSRELTECRALLDNIAAESSGKLKVRKKNKGKEKTLQPKVAPSPETEVNACSDNNDIKAPNSKEATVEPVDRNLSTKVQDPNAKLLDHK